MKFSKIKYNADKAKVELHWTSNEAGDEIERKLTSGNAPEPALPAALAAFSPIVAELLHVAPSWDREAIVITGISLNTEEGDDSDRRGIVITCRKSIAGSNAPFMFNTPHFREPTESAPIGTAGIFPAGMQEAIDAAEKAASAYVTGHREQISFLDGETYPAELADCEEVEAPKQRRRAKATAGGAR